MGHKWTYWSRKAGKKAGDKKLASVARQLREVLLKNLTRLIEWSSRVWRKSVPPGIDCPFGEDWGNLLLLYPNRVIDEETAKAVVQRYRKRMSELVGRYGAFLHAYIIERVAQNCLILGDQKCALEIFYGMFLHTGSAHDGFEWCVLPWGDRDYCLRIGPITLFCNYPPHGWFAANLNALLRNMLIREEGDSLHLLSAVSPCWFRRGSRISVKKALTKFGLVSFSVTAKESGFDLEISAEWRRKPKKLIIHAPYFARPIEESSAGEIIEDGSAVVLEPYVNHVTIKAKVRPPALSYEAVVREYLKRYHKFS